MSDKIFSSENYYNFKKSQLNEKTMLNCYNHDNAGLCGMFNGCSSHKRQFPENQWWISSCECRSHYYLWRRHSHQQLTPTCHRARWLSQCAGKRWPPRRLEELFYSSGSKKPRRMCQSSHAIPQWIWLSHRRGKSIRTCFYQRQEFIKHFRQRLWRIIRLKIKIQLRTKWPWFLKPLVNHPPKPVEAQLGQQSARWRKEPLQLYLDLCLWHLFDLIP